MRGWTDRRGLSREPLTHRTSAPPIFMQVLVPSILTKPAPYSAQALAGIGALQRQQLAGRCGLVRLLGTGLLGDRSQPQATRRLS